MYCHHCGARISDMANSCPRCGRDVVRWAIRERLDQLERRINWLAEALQRIGKEVAPWLREGKPEVPAERVEPVAPPAREKGEAPRPLAQAVRPPERASAPPPRERTSTAAMEVAYVQRVLLWVGLIALAVGVGLFVLYAVGRLGPWGKAGCGYGFAVVLISVGLYVGRRFERYGQVLTGAGAGLFYFMTYAIYFFAATRIIHDQLVELILLAVVAFCLIAYALRFQSEAVTASAFALGYVSTNVGSITQFSLVTLLILTAVLALTSARRGWNALLLGGVFATYGTHLRWIVGGAHAGGIPWSDIAGSSALLTGYFVCYTLPGLWSPGGTRTKVPSELIALVTTNGFFWTLLSASSIESFRSGTFGIVMFVAAGAHLAIAGCSRLLRKQANDYLVWAIAAVVLTFLAVPIQFRGYAVPSLWMLLGAVLYLIGTFRNVSLCRWLGPTISIVAYLFFWVQLVMLGPGVGWIAENARLLSGIWLVLAGFGLRGLHLQRTSPRPSVEEGVSIYSSIFAAITLFALIYLEAPKILVPLGWGSATLLLLGWAALTRDSVMRIAGLAGAVLTIGLGWQCLDTVKPITLAAAWVPFLGTCVFLYLGSWVSRASSYFRETPLVKYEPEVYSLIAGLALFLLLGYRVGLPWLPLVWGIVGLGMLYFVALATDDRGLRIAGLVGGALALLALWYEMCSVPKGEFLGRTLAEKWLPVAAIAVGFYLVSASRDLWKRVASGVSNEEVWGASLAAGLTLVTTLYSRVGAPFLAVSWFLAAGFLIAIAVVRLDTPLRACGLVSSALGLIVFCLDFVRRPDLALLPQEVGLPVWLTGLSAFVILYVTGRVYRLSGPEREDIPFLDKAYFPLAAGLCLWFGLSAAFPKQWLSLSWLLAGLVQVGVGLALADLYIRRFGLGLLSLVVCKAFLFDLPQFGGLVRTVSFLALGGILLGVSYCYYRYRDLILKHL